jgi:hypothetical protein
MAVRIDRSNYTNSPNGSGRQLLSLGRVLRKRTPSNPSPDLAAAAGGLDKTLVAAQGVYADRIRNHGPAVALMDREDDNFADTVLRIGRDRLLHWELFTRPTAQRLAAAKPPDGPDYAAVRVKAERAAEIHNKLFANDFDSTRAPYAVQAEYMLMLERIIEEEQLGDDLAELIGEPYYTNMRATITLYAKMVERRQSGDAGSEANLREVRYSLYHAIQNYLLALLATIRDDDPESVAAVRRALGPVDAYRASFARRPGAGGAGEAEDGADVDADAVEELVAAQQELDAEIGYVDAGEADGATL